MMREKNKHAFQQHISGQFISVQHFFKYNFNTLYLIRMRRPIPKQIVEFSEAVVLIQRRGENIWLK
jgi:hypothetical protein